MSGVYVAGWVGVGVFEALNTRTDFTTTSSSSFLCFIWSSSLCFSCWCSCVCVCVYKGLDVYVSVRKN